MLDEATASVDSDTEARLQRALDAAMTGRTALIIAHRLSTSQCVDRIVAFHKGLRRAGHARRAARAGGVYACLHRLPFAREQIHTVVASVR